MLESRREKTEYFLNFANLLNPFTNWFKSNKISLQEYLESDAHYPGCFLHIGANLRESPVTQVILISIMQLRKLRGRRQQKRLQVVILQRNVIFTGLGIQKNLGQYFGFLKLKSMSSVNNLHVVSKSKNMKKWWGEKKMEQYRILCKPTSPEKV